MTSSSQENIIVEALNEVVQTLGGKTLNYQCLSGTINDINFICDTLFYSGGSSSSSTSDGFGGGASYSYDFYLVNIKDLINFVISPNTYKETVNSNGYSKTCSAKFSFAYNSGPGLTVSIIQTDTIYEQEGCACCCDNPTSACCYDSCTCTETETAKTNAVATASLNGGVIVGSLTFIIGVIEPEGNTLPIKNVVIGDVETPFYLSNFDITGLTMDYDSIKCVLSVDGGPNTNVNVPESIVSTLDSIIFPEFTSIFTETLNDCIFYITSSSSTTSQIPSITAY